MKAMTSRDNDDKLDDEYFYDKWKAERLKSKSEILKNFEGWFKYNQEAFNAAGITSKESARIILEDYALARRNTTRRGEG